ncbi:DNA helicase RecG [Candidatus Kaiserbacteria bacterium CG10_big_fil_rev_8_21_14_0_10_45_20]|uniref:Probable DNA 3'-5' helicase RecG n=1 Tax=Candidatus Kaiserbacteria bacterium CG10_big_fil_rev_8_21_14_0_10_45_20 TaxID=1974607 RepID=A0A2H0UFN0_9BACT|nr:MAG: DNA helicase RecG [Candidatus Kaiserbacteria bacterium CG10_big_fil_rev_8_21_14_0_10_45_20]
MKPHDTLSSHFRIQKQQAVALTKLGIETVLDLLYHIPSRYESSADIRRIATAEPNETVVIYGQFSKLEIKKSFRTKVPMAEGSFSDGSHTLRVVWFHQPYLAKMIQEGELVRIRGKVTERNGKKYVANPVVEKATCIPILEGYEGLFPVYPESAGVSSLWLYHTIQKVLRSDVLDFIEDVIPPTILKKYNLPSLRDSFVFAHQPKKEKDAETARKRFAFEEVFLIQVDRAKERERNKNEKSYVIDTDKKKLQTFIDSFPFTPTKGQVDSISDILKDFENSYPMHRLLEGDVGSGKTAVAAATAYSVVTSRPHGQDFGNLQVAYMVPTEILAKQHFKTFTDFFIDHPINIGLITSSGCYKFPSKVNKKDATPISRTQLLKWVANGEIPILIGTHSLIQKTVNFKHLAYVIIDEQHRFGTAQRKEIAKKDGASPHLLSMTATPIPRTLALTLYGDLDLTVLEQMPLGRKAIVTDIITPPKRDTAYKKVLELLKEGHQAYVICPRIDEPDPTKYMALQTRSVASETKRLKESVFPEWRIEKLHSKMTPKEKEDVMNSFANGEIDILVATSVVEVGVNVPNATVIMIEGADRFGLAQLHQLRGRVMRSSHQPYCFLMVESSAKSESSRLKAIQTAKNGFELAEKDLSIRGAGELYGRHQSGLSDIGMEALKNLKLVEAARTEAFALVAKDPILKKHPALGEMSQKKARSLHFE